MYAIAQTAPGIAIKLGSSIGDYMKSTHTIIVVMIAATALVSGCASNNPRPANNEYYSRPATSQPHSHTYGVIESIDVIRGNEPGVAGTVIGGVIGGVLGHQVGGGRGKTAATIAGAAGGAVVGHEIEKNRQGRDRYQVRVRIDRDRIQTVTQDDITDLHVGTRVRIENDRAYRD
jgi:outer membrane lipoprotein SlyB